MLPDPTRDAVPQQRILVVDDDRSVGLAIKVALKPLQITFAQSAAGALARVEAGGNFDAIVCDLNMPGMTGMEFHDAVAKVAPSLAARIVFVTGGATTPNAIAFLERTTNTCIQKPFQREALRAAVAAAARRAR